MVNQDSTVMRLWERFVVIGRVDVWLVAVSFARQAQVDDELLGASDSQIRVHKCQLGHICLLVYSLLSYLCYL